MRTSNKGVYIKVLKNNNRLLSGYYSFHIVSFVVDRGYTLLFYLVLYYVYNQLNNIYLQGVLFCFILYYFAHFWVKIWVKDF